MTMIRARLKVLDIWDEILCDCNHFYVTSADNFAAEDFSHKTRLFER